MSSLQKRRLGWMAAGTVVVGGGIAIVVTSSGTGAAPSPSVSAPIEDCQIRLDGPQPELGALETPKLPSSRLAVHVEVDTKWLSAQLDKKIPTRLAAADRKPIGKPGEVTYTVTRGPFTYSVAKDRLTVNAPVAANIEVCKPVGPFCPTYGSCAPRVVASASVPLVVNKDYKLDASQVSYGINEGCSIVGLDVTDKMRQVADGRIGQIKQQIDDALPDVEAAAKAAFGALNQPRALPGGGCLHASAEDLAQGHPSLADGTISWHATLTGKLELFPEKCPAVGEAVLPPVRVVDDGPSAGAIGAAVVVPWEAVGKDLASSAMGAEASGPSYVRGLEARGGTLDGKPALLLGVTVDGAMCGQAWLRADLRHDGERLRLDRVEPLPGQPEAVAGIARALAEKGAITTPALLTAVLAELTGLERRLDEIDTKLPAKPTLELAPATVSAIYGASGITLFAERRGRARLVLKEPAK